MITLQNQLLVYSAWLSLFSAGLFFSKDVNLVSTRKNLIDDIHYTLCTENTCILLTHSDTVANYCMEVNSVQTMHVYIALIDML